MSEKDQPEELTTAKLFDSPDPSWSDPPKQSDDPIQVARECSETTAYHELLQSYQTLLAQYEGIMAAATSSPELEATEQVEAICNIITTIRYLLQSDDEEVIKRMNGPNDEVQNYPTAGDILTRCLATLLNSPLLTHGRD